MDTKESSASTRRDSTRAVTTDRNLADQIAAVLLCDREPIRDAFVGEPVMESMLMCAWALDHEHEPGFDPARALKAWARKRRRGAWREAPGDEETASSISKGGVSQPRSGWGVWFSNEQVQANLDRMSG